MKAECKNCIYKNIWRTNIPLWAKIFAPCCVDKPLSEGCFFDFKQTKNPHTGVVALPTSFTLKSYYNSEGGCEHFKPKGKGMGG